MFSLTDDAVLHHDPDLLPQRFTFVVLDLDAVDQNLAMLYLVEPEQKTDDR